MILVWLLHFVAALTPASAKQMDAAACAPEVFPVLEEQKEVQEIAGRLLGEPDETLACEQLKKVCHSGCENYQLPEKNCGLTKAQYNALRFYTANGYTCLNGALRNKSLKHDDPAVQLLNRALDQFPNFVGFVSRGVDLPKEVLALHQVGAVLEFPAFTSTSTGRGFVSTVNYRIFSKTGKPIMNFSGIPAENEVLFKAPTRFKILSVNRGFGHVTVVMKEVGNEPKSSEEEVEEDRALLKSYRRADTIQTRDTWTCNSSTAVSGPEKADLVQKLKRKKPRVIRLLNRALGK